jgi:dihydroneopterin aldolase
MQIQLQDCSFFGFHGMHEEEKKMGNTFIVNLTVDFEPPNGNIVHINDTVDYVSLYQIVENRMLQTTSLLETIVQDIANEVLVKFLMVHQVQVSITKMHLPIPRFEGKAMVSLTKQR